MRSFVIIRTRFEGVHCWPECPFEEVGFLQHPHRHIFHVEVKIPVTHSDRDVEFIMAKRALEDGTSLDLPRNLGERSCEDLCEAIYKVLKKAEIDVHSVKVFEDNENGAEVIFEEE